MGHKRVCESEQRYRALEHDGTLKRVIGAYAVGQRTSDILDTLARARVWSYNFGEWLPLPTGYNRTTWTDILNALVLRRLGDQRCLDCGGFFRTTKALGCFIGTRGRVRSHVCPHCGGTAHDVIGCTEGVV